MEAGHLIKRGDKRPGITAQLLLIRVPFKPSMLSSLSFSLSLLSQRVLFRFLFRSLDDLKPDLRESALRRVRSWLAEAAEPPRGLYYNPSPSCLAAPAYFRVCPPPPHFIISYTHLVHHVNRAKSGSVGSIYTELRWTKVGSWSGKNEKGRCSVS